MLLSSEWAPLVRGLVIVGAAAWLLRGYARDLLDRVRPAEVVPEGRDEVVQAFYTLLDFAKATKCDAMRTALEGCAGSILLAEEPVDAEPK